MSAANYRRQDRLGVSNSLTQRGDFIEKMKYKGLYELLSPYSRLQSSFKQ